MRAGGRCGAQVLVSLFVDRTEAWVYDDELLDFVQHKDQHIGEAASAAWAPTVACSTSSGRAPMPDEAPREDARSRVVVAVARLPVPVHAEAMRSLLQSGVLKCGANFNKAVMVSTRNRAGAG